MVGRARVREGRVWAITHARKCPESRNSATGIDSKVGHNYNNNVKPLTRKTNTCYDALTSMMNIPKYELVLWGTAVARLSFDYCLATAFFLHTSALGYRPEPPLSRTPHQKEGLGTRLHTNIVPTL